MPRQMKKSLDFFYLDCDIFSKKSELRPLLRRYKSDGLAVFVHILCDVYGSNGYYFKPDNFDDYIYDIAEDCGITAEKVQLIIAFMKDRTLLDAFSLDKNTAFTSHEIQKHYAEAMKLRKRSIAEIKGDYWILTEEEEEEINTFYKGHTSTDKSEKNSDKSEKNSDKSEIYSTKESKVNKSKKEKIYKKEKDFFAEEEESEKADETENSPLIAEKSSLTERAVTKAKIEEYFDKTYGIYPRKVNKIQAKETFEHKFRELSEEEAYKKARQLYSMLKKQIELWGKENDGIGRRIEMIPHFSTWLNDNIENSPRFKRGKG